MTRRDSVAMARRLFRSCCFVVLVVTACLAVLSVTPARTAEVTCLVLAEPNSPAPGNRSDCAWILIEGAIAAGDARKVEELLASPAVTRVVLWSSGGLVEEALKIGGLVRAALLTTEAPSRVGFPNFPVGSGYITDPHDNVFNIIDRRAILGGRFSLNQPLICSGPSCHCASACAFIWAAGIERDGEVIGLHRPSISSTAFAALPPAQAGILYRRLLQEISSYLNEMEVSQTYVSLATGIDSSEIRWLSADEAQALSEVPSISEWLRASCGVMPKEEQDTLDALIAKGASLKPDEISRLNTLLDKWSTVDQCVTQRLQSARDALDRRHLAN